MTWMKDISDAVLARAGDRGTAVFFDSEASFAALPVPPQLGSTGVDLETAARQSGVLPSIEAASRVPPHRAHRWGGR